MKSLYIVPLLLSLQLVMGFKFEDLEEPVIQKCSPPKQFEGKFKLNFKSTEGPVITGTGTIHVDYTTAMAFTSSKYAVNGTSYGSSTYVRNNMTYVVRPSRMECSKQHYGYLPGTVPAGVPVTISRGVLQGVHVQIWQCSFNQGRDTVTYYVTENKCELMKVTMKGHNSYLSKDYHDMKEGIQDPRIFDLPKYCVKESYYVNFLRQVQIVI